MKRGNEKGGGFFEKAVKYQSQVQLLKQWLENKKRSFFNRT